MSPMVIVGVDGPVVAVSSTLLPGHTVSAVAVTVTCGGSEMANTSVATLSQPFAAV